jgi:triosephosphate isomerase
VHNTLTPFVGGNWKMNTNRATASDLARAVAEGLSRVEGIDAAVFPPFPYLLTVRSILRDRGSSILLGAQDAAFQPDGAFTGEVSVAMLADCGVQAVLVGHSERRHVIGEKDDLINKKLRAVLDAGLLGVLCVGETSEERQAGHEEIVVTRQVKTALAEVSPDALVRLVVAYEPVWAIGTGNTATPQDAKDAHASIRAQLARTFGPAHAGKVRVIYGGSVKPDSAGPIFAQEGVEGGLIGGASLSGADFVAICKHAAAAAQAKRAAR